jgi:hypothetical protein
LGPAFAVWICSAVWLGVTPALVSLLGILQWKSLPFPESGRIVQVNAGSAALKELIRPRLDLESLLLCAAGWLFVAVTSTAVAWISSRQLGLRSLLSSEGSGTPASSRVGRLRLALVCVALAVAMALGATTETLRQSLANLEDEPLGFEPRGVVSAVVRFGQAAPTSEPSAQLARLTGRLESLPGVAAVGFSDSHLFGGSARFLEASTFDRSRFWMVRIQRIYGQYLQASGLQLLAGRALSPLELETGSPMALLDQTGARRMFPEGGAVGRTIVVGEDQVEIVGLVESAKATSLDEPARPQVYLPLLLGRPAAQQALATTLRVTEPLRETAIAEAVASEGGAVSQIRPVAEDIAASLAASRVARNMVLVVSVAILVLAVLTTFATFSWHLELRAQELAVRQVLGETLGGLARRTLQGALWVTGAAAVLGLALYLPAAKILRGFVFGVDVLTPSVLLASYLGIGALALAATATAVGLALRRQVTGLAGLLSQR